MSPRCTAEPVSWLRLERFHLGELGAAEREGIAGHLAVCPACAACLARIEDDDTRALPLLSLSRPVSGGVLSFSAGRVGGPFSPGRVGAALSPGRVAAALGALAAAAALVLSLRGSKPAATLAQTDPTGSRVKGDAVAFSLVREDGERTPGTEGVYRDGDRFEAMVTCPPGGNVEFDLVVHDDGGASFPLEHAREVACGNEVRLPGAFRLTGDAEETVCLVWSQGAPLDRGELASRGKSDDGALCKVLAPAPRPGR